MGIIAVATSTSACSERGSSSRVPHLRPVLGVDLADALERKARFLDAAPCAREVSSTRRTSLAAARAKPKAR